MPLCAQALRSGYTSVMIDGSKLPLEENIALTYKVSEMCAAVGVPVEGEIGRVGGKEDDLESDGGYTIPEEAVRFEKESGLFSMAVGVGTAHGFYKEKPQLNKELITTLRGMLQAPMVLHGASGLSDEDVKDCIRRGICKVNFATELRAAYTEGVKAVLAENPQDLRPQGLRQRGPPAGESLGDGAHAGVRLRREGLTMKTALLGIDVGNLRLQGWLPSTWRAMCWPRPPKATRCSTPSRAGRSRTPSSGGMPCARPSGGCGKAAPWPPGEVAGVGIDGQSWSAIPLDKEGRALCNTPIWMDTRAGSLCQELEARVGGEKIFACSGNPLSASYTLPKVLWYKEHLPQVYEKAEKVLQSNGYLAFRLTGAVHPGQEPGLWLGLLQCGPEPVGHPPVPGAGRKALFAAGDRLLQPGGGGASRPRRPRRRACWRAPLWWPAAWTLPAAPWGRGSSTPGRPRSRAARQGA